MLSLIWGSSFLLIRISVEEMDELQIVFMRSLIAAIGLNAILFLRGKRWPTDWRTLRSLILLGVMNPAIPFILITWGEKSVESGLASVLQSTAALFGLIFAHFAFADERMNMQKALGLGLGFIGVLVLSSRSWAAGAVLTGDLLGQLAIVVASLFYALSTTYSKLSIHDLEPIMISAGAMTTAAIITGILMLVAPLAGGSAPVPLTDVSTNVLLSVLMLGFMNTFIAYLIFYSLVRSLGAGRTQMVTYVVPVVGLFLGAVFLNEVIDARLIAGASLIFAGIALVNLQLGRIRFLRRVQPAP